MGEKYNEKNNKESISRPEFCVSAKDLNNMLIEIEEKNIKIYGDIIKKPYYRPYYSEGKIIYKGIDGKDYPDMASLEQADKLYWKRQLERLQSAIEKYYDALLKRIEKELPLEDKKLAPKIAGKIVLREVEENATYVAAKKIDEELRGRCQTLIKY